VRAAPNNNAPGALFKHPSLPRPLPPLPIITQRCLQKALLKDVTVLRPLGEGAYAWVDLLQLSVKSKCGTPGKTVPRVVAGKLLLPDGAADNIDGGRAGGGGGAGPPGCVLARWTATAAAARGPVKPTPPCAFVKQKRVHAECQGSSFVVQLLAAKQGRDGHMLMLLEFAEHGSLADFLPDGGAAAAGSSDEVVAAIGGLRPQGPAAAAAAGGCECGPGSGGGGGGGSASGSVRDGEADCGSDDEGACDLVIDLLTSADGGDDDTTTTTKQQPPQQQQQQQQPPPGIPEPTAKFYAACVLEALSFMHARRVIHRDVKPDNLLLFSSGYLKLSDLGAATIVPPGEAATTRSGTAEYMAPEVKAQLPQCPAVDLWSLGVTVWQLVAGGLPAWAEREEAHEGELEFPEHFSQVRRRGRLAGWVLTAAVAIDLCSRTADHPTHPTTPSRPDSPRPTPKHPPETPQDLRSLLTALLRHDPKSRPCAVSVRDHPWFDGFDWDALREQRLSAPPVPPRPTEQQQPPQQQQQQQQPPIKEGPKDGEPCRRCGGALKAEEAAAAATAAEAPAAARAAE
jgi:serine/threonine protein kinase